MNFDKDEFLKRAYEYKNDWINTTKKLVSFNSVLEEYDENSDTPFGQGNKDALDWILDFAKKDGFETYNCDNYAGHIAWGEGEDLGILAHLDVVPAVGNWTHDPFDATLVENDTKLVGRGVNDDKGPLVASYYAMKILRDMKVKPNKRVLLIMGCDEESGSRCLKHYFSKNPMPKIGFSPDACFPLINGEKVGVHYFVKGKIKTHVKKMYAGERMNIVPDLAYMELDVDLKNEYLEFLRTNGYEGKIENDQYVAYGVSAHAMSPDKGKNAAFVLFEFVNQYAKDELSSFMVDYLVNDPFGNKLKINVHHDEMKDLTQNIGMIRVDNGEVMVGVDCRVPVENHEPLMQQMLDEALAGTSLSAEVHKGGVLHYVPKNSELVQTLLSSYRDITGDTTSDAYTIGGGTYAKFIDNAVAFGPQFIGREDVDHQVDEYVYVEDYVKVMAIYADAIYKLVK